VPKEFRAEQRRAKGGPEKKKEVPGFWEKQFGEQRLVMEGFGFRLIWLGDRHQKRKERFQGKEHLLKIGIVHA